MKNDIDNNLKEKCVISECNYDSKVPNIITITTEYKLVEECLRFIPLSPEIKDNLDLCLVAQHLKSYFDIKLRNKQLNNEQMTKLRPND